MSDEASIAYGLPFFKGGGKGDAGWRARGLCVDLHRRDPELAACFFAEEVVRQRRAKALCAECPSKTPCLEYGLHEVTGVWGGEGVRARQRLLASGRVIVRPRS